MTGRELKATIFEYLKSRGWSHLKPNEFYAWAPPGYDPTDPNDVDILHYYCWHAALLVQLAEDENRMIRLPDGAFEVVKGGRR